MKFSKVFLTALLAGLSLFAAAAELTFGVKISRSGESDLVSGGAKQNQKKIQKKNVAVFLIDCSGSMWYYDLDGKEYSERGKKWNRAQLVTRKMLPERFRALPLDSEVYVYLYSTKVNPDNVPFKKRWWKKEYAKFTSREIRERFLSDLQGQIIAIAKKNGLTPYFDAKALVLEEMRNGKWLQDPNVRLQLLDYTDGANFTGGQSWRFKYGSNNGTSFARAKADFERDWAGVLARIGAKKKEGGAFVSIQNIGTERENPGVNRISEYGVEFACDKKVLKNFQETIGLFASFPLDEDNWKLLLKQRGAWGVKVQFGSEPGRFCTIFPGKPEKQFKVPVPDLKGKTTKVTVSFVCPREAPGVFKLILPKPIEFYLSAPQAKATIERVEVQNTTFRNGQVLTVLEKDENGKREKVFFKAEGSAKEYVWKFSDRTEYSANGEVLSRTFDKAQPYRFSVFPKDNRESKIEGTINVVAIGIELEQPKAGLTGEKVSFRAVSRGNLKPSSCVWYVEGPLGKAETPVADDDKAKGAAAANKEKRYSVSLDSKTLGSSHVFEEPGKYEVKVKACYDGLDQTCEDKRLLVVKEPLAIEFSGMEPNGSNLDFRKQVTLKIKATKGAIKPGSVVWKANGNVIGAARGRTECMYPPEGEPKREKVTFSVEAEDAAVPGRKVTPEPATITYNLDCDHPDKLEVGSFRVGEKTASGAFRLYDKVEFRLMKGQYKDIIWTFGDDGKTGKPDAGQQSVVHVMSKAGKFPHTVVCKCAKCDKDFKGSLETDTESKEPKPVLSLKPMKTSYVKGDKVLLCDTGTGDYFKCRLLKWNPEKGDYDVYKDGLDPHFEVEISLGGEEFPVPVGRTDFKFQLQALDREGKTVLKEAECTVRVRPSGLVAALISLAAIVVFIIVFRALGKLLLNNEALGWELHHRRKEEKPPMDKAESQEVGKIRPPKRLKENHRWIRKQHRAIIPLRELLAESPADAQLTINPLQEKWAKKMELSGVTETNQWKMDSNSTCLGVVFEILSLSKDGKRKVYLELVLDMSRNYYGDSIFYWTLLVTVLAALVVAGLWVFYF